MPIVEADFKNLIRQVKEGGTPISVTLTDGKIHTGRIDKVDSNSFSVTIGRNGDREIIPVNFSDVISSEVISH